MHDDTPRRRSTRPQLVLVALVFIAPLAAAVILYYAGDRLHPEGRTNHGVLLSPVVSLSEAAPASELPGRIADRWALVYRHQGRCGDACRDTLYKLRQSRLMLGNDMNRVERVFLHGPEAPDTVFLDREHRGMIVMNDPAAASVLESSRPRGAEPGGYFLLDPLGNLVMYFPAGIQPRHMVEDLAHLLELSRIG